MPPTVTETPVATLTATLLSVVATDTPELPTSTPTEAFTATPTLLPTPKPTVTVTVMPTPSYPCEGKIVSLTNSKEIIQPIVHLGPSDDTGTAILDFNFDAGQVVIITQDNKTRPIWYEIWLDSTTRLGWVPGQYLEMSSLCPDVITKGEN